MGIITKEVEVKPSGKMIKYYRDKGYDAKWREPLIVNVEDLSAGSKCMVLVKCDFCDREPKYIQYADYLKSIKKYGKYSCVHCSNNKSTITCLEKYGKSNYSKTEESKNHRKKVCLKKYGVKDYFQTEEFKEKKRQYNLNKYGVDNYAKTKECHKKMEDTMYKLYGVKNAFHSEEIKNRAKQTWLDTYGYENPFYSYEIKEKARNTILQKYGCYNPMQSPEIREKVNKTLCENGNQKTSTQQLYLNSLFSGELNYPIKYYSVDICFPEEKIILEYDGGFHDGRVKLGRLTQEEFDHKELVREQVIKHEGYCIIRIISRHDYLPSDEILLQLLSHSKEYFSTTFHTWIHWDVDNSKMINAENKDLNGSFFNFGELRKIKKSDLLDSENCA